MTGHLLDSLSPSLSLSRTGDGDATTCECFGHHLTVALISQLVPPPPLVVVVAVCVEDLDLKLQLSPHSKTREVRRKNSRSHFSFHFTCAQ